ncbi:MAG: HNH endonuclease [Planctomycetaceae bacterium]
MAQSANRACERCQAPTRNGRFCVDCRPSEPAPVTKRVKRESASKRGYDRHWRTARAAYLSEAGNQICHECKQALATVVDHIEAHRGDHTMFWDRENWQALCARCHNRKTRKGG